MSVTRPLLTAGLIFLLTSCGYLSENPKAALEQQWLQQDPQIAEAVKQIREQGLAAVAGSAEAGTVANSNGIFQKGQLYISCFWSHKKCC